MWFGVRIADDILITANRYENLTSAPKGHEMLDTIRDGGKYRYEDGCYLCTGTGLVWKID